jgi:hypothetical protein
MVKASWIEQGIWRSDFERWMTDYRSDAGIWKHEEPLDTLSDYEADAYATSAPPTKKKLKSRRCTNSSKSLTLSMQEVASNPSSQ